MRRKANVLRGLTSVLAFLLSFSLLMTYLLIDWKGQVNVVLHVTAPTTVQEGYIRYPSEFTLDDDGMAKMLAASGEHDIQTMAEGAVLLKNDNAALPLKKEERRITLFGRGSADPVYRGNSGGPTTTGNPRLVSLHDALTEKGFEINEKLFNAYLSSNVKRRKAEPDWFIGEVDSSFYTDELKSSYASDYNDAAIVVFSRDGGEGKDLAQVDCDGVSYLSLHETEKQLLHMIKDSGKFAKTIVLVNSAYPMECGWMFEEEYGVDAALWIGDPALLGFRGVAKLLTGESDPSGRFTDTYAASSLSAPAVRNAGNFKFANNPTVPYEINAEGIYVGYKYYETRYYDQVLGIHNATSEAGVYAGENGGWDYASEMTFPFGYGISYTNFQQELKKLVWDRNARTVTATVQVENLGAPEGSSFDGKSRSVVELYVSLPYEEGQAEKSAIQLIGFGKTKPLAKGEKEEIEITVDDYLFAIYDSNAVNGSDATKQGCYVFDHGDYCFAIGSDCHDALNNVLALTKSSEAAGKLVNPDGTAASGNPANAAMVTLAELDNTTYAVSPETGVIVCNRFENADYNHYEEGAVTYLTRQDWNTYPISYVDMAAPDQMIAELKDDDYKKPENAPDYKSIVTEADNGLTFADMAEVPYEDDETWNKFLDQLSLTDLCAIVDDNFGNAAIASVSKPENKNSDGPAGPQGSYLYGEKLPTACHVSEVVAASTWDTELMARRGSFIGEDCLFTGITELWSPGADLHRTPFSGRNFEYYSEDSIMSYIMGYYQTAAMQEKGTIASIKHFCGNDQETNRDGLCVFMTEQTFRQGSLKGFEGAFTKGGALGTMMCFNRIGVVRMYQNPEALTGVLRGEWGYKGLTITDSCKGDKEVKTVSCLVSGTNVFADTGRSSEIKKHIVTKKDGYAMEKLREANKHFYYAMSRSNLVNGLTASTTVSNFVPWWQKTLYGLDTALAVLFAASAVMTVVSIVSKPKSKEKQHKGKGR